MTPPMIEKKDARESCLRCAWYSWLDSETKFQNWCTYWKRRSDYPYATCIAYAEVKFCD